MNLLDLVAEHMVDHFPHAKSPKDAVELLATLHPSKIVSILQGIKVEAVPFSSGVRTFELSDEEE